MGLPGEVMEKLQDTDRSTISGSDRICNYFLGDACRCWSLGNQIDRKVSRVILSVYRRLQKNPRLAELGVIDLVPSYTALALHAHPLADWNAIQELVEGEFSIGRVADRLDLGGTTHRLPVVYQGEDLPRVAEHCRLSLDEVINRHSRVDYLVAMIGFRPHFPYLLGLDPALAVPRLDSPRLKVSAGAVAIGGDQTGVYPEESPGGWNIIGSTDPALLLPIRPGDTVIFVREET